MLLDLGMVGQKSGRWQTIHELLLELVVGGCRTIHELLEVVVGGRRTIHELLLEVVV